MKIDTIRLKKHLSDIVRGAHDQKMVVDQNTLLPDSIKLKAAKYILIELAEAMSNTLQHILAKKRHCC